MISDSLSYRLWEGETFIIIGSGPSLSLKQISLIYQSYLYSKIKVIAVNDNYQIVPWANVHYACDYKWYQWHARYLFKPDQFDSKARKKMATCAFFHGLKYTTDLKAANEWHHLGLRYIKGKDAPGLSIEPGIIHYGRNSGYQAVNLAYLMGARKIILIGFDHKFPGNVSHWHGDHPDRIRSWYEHWMPCWESVKDQLSELNLKIINCTPDSNLKCFPQKKIDTILNEL